MERAWQRDTIACAASRSQTDKKSSKQGLGPNAYTLDTTFAVLTEMVAFLGWLPHGNASTSLQLTEERVNEIGALRGVTVDILHMPIRLRMTIVLVYCYSRYSIACVMEYDGISLATFSIDAVIESWSLSQFMSQMSLKTKGIYHFDGWYKGTALSTQS